MRFFLLGVVSTIIYIIMGLGFHNILCLTKEKIDLILDVLLWPLGLIFFAFAKKE